jgi:hypothetical protein
MAEGWSPIPDWLMEHAGVSAQAKLIWTVLHRLQGNDACSYPSYKALARMAGGITERQLLRYIDELESKWLLEIRITSFTGAETNPYGFRSNLFVVHEGNDRYPTRASQRKARLKFSAARSAL